MSHANAPINTPIIAPVSLSTADPKALATLNAVKAKIGMIPNLYATLAHSPAALNGLLAINEALGAGVLTGGEREIVALATAQANSCRYCLSAHTLLGKMAGLSVEQVAQSRAGFGTTAREAAIAGLAKSITTSRGHVGAAAVAAARAAGLSDADLMEIVVGVAANVLTNFTNNLSGTAIDFPVVDAALAA